MSTITLIVLTCLYLLGFALLHTAMSSSYFKAYLRKKLGSGFAFYRLFYNVFSLLLLAGFLSLFSPYNRIIYHWSEPLKPLAYAVIGLATLLIVWVLFATFDFLEFAGLRFSHELEPNQGQLQQNGPYRYCRHPIYFGTLLIMLFIPTITLLSAVFTVFVLAYSLLGSIPEERKLVNQYGEAYQRYQQQTKRLIPFLL